jgi:ribonuclease III
MAADPFDLEQKIGYRFNDHQLLINALTHASSVTDREGGGNDRLELVGDAVIDLAVAHMLYTYHPEKDEGWLTQMRAHLVDEECLASKARDLGLGDFLILGKGEQKVGGREKSSILAGGYEALMGAVFIDGGYDACNAVIERHYGEIETLTDDIHPKNYKSLLQERLQKDGLSLPRYEVTEISGPDHERIYCVSVIIEGNEWGRGSGRNKKEAEQRAARGALQR